MTQVRQHFLLVHLDDDPNDLRLFEEAIDRTGVPIRFLQFLYQKKAIQWLESEAKNSDLGNSVKLLLCDYNLGPVKAPTIIPWVKGIFASDLLIVVFSGCADEDAVALSYGCGAHCFLRKPSSMQRLHEIVRKLYEAISSGRVEPLTRLEEYAPPSRSNAGAEAAIPKHFLLDGASQ